MLNRIDWIPRMPYDAVCLWHQYEDLQSINDRVLCCLALNKEPYFAGSLVPVPFKANFTSYDSTIEVKPESAEDIQSRFDDLNAERIYTYRFYVICADNEDYDEIENLTTNKFNDLEFEYFKKIANEVRITSLLPDLEEVGLYGTFDRDGWIRKFQDVLYKKAIADDWFVDSEDNPKDIRKAVRIAERFHEEAFKSSFNKLYRLMQEHRPENGGILKYLEGTDRIKITVFSEWADSMGLVLPEKFPRNRKTNGKSKKYLIWQDRVDELYSKNNKLSHLNICMRLAPELGTSSENLRRRTDNPTKK